MKYSLQLILWFGAGIILEAFFLVRHKVRAKKLLRGLTLCLIGALFVFVLSFVFTSSISSTLGESDNFRIALATSFISLLIYFGAAFRKEILPKISEQTLLLFTLLFWYVFLTRAYAHLSYIWAIFPLVPSLGVLLIASTKVQLGFFWKIFFYTWFIAINVFLISVYYFSAVLCFFLNKTAGEPVSWLNTLLTGMAFMYLVVNIWYIFELTPILYGDNKSFKRRIQRWKEHNQMIANKYTNYQLKPPRACLIILFQGGIFVLSYFLKFLPEIFVISISILVMPRVISFFEKRPAKVSADSLNKK